VHVCQPIQGLADCLGPIKARAQANLVESTLQQNEIIGFIFDHDEQAMARFGVRRTGDLLSRFLAAKRCTPSGLEDRFGLTDWSAAAKTEAAVQSLTTRATASILSGSQELIELAATTTSFRG
jgi:hypothetical protein